MTACFGLGPGLVGEPLQLADAISPALARSSMRDSRSCLSRSSPASAAASCSARSAQSASSRAISSASSPERNSAMNTRTADRSLSIASRSPSAASYLAAVATIGSNASSCSRARRTASCALVKSSKWAMMSRTRSVASLGSSMWSRTKSLRLPTDFIETVWWNSSSACSDRIPSRRRNDVAYFGNSSKISAPAPRSRLRRSRRSEPNSAKSAAIVSCLVAVTKKRYGCPALSRCWKTCARVTVSS